MLLAEYSTIVSRRRRSSRANACGQWLNERTEASALTTVDATSVCPVVNYNRVERESEFSRTFQRVSEMPPNCVVA